MAPSASAPFILMRINNSCTEKSYAQIACYLHDGMDEYVLNVLDVSVNCILANMVGAFGIFGNVINIAVLRLHGFKESTNVILFSLSISDLLFSAMLPLTKLGCLVQYFDQALAATISSFGVVYLFMPKFVAAANSFSLIALIAAERFVAVFFPFHAAKVFSAEIMKILTSLVAIFSFISIFPTFFAYSYQWQFDERYNQTVAVVRSTVDYDIHKEFLDIYMWVAMNNMFCTFSMTFVFICCVAIGLKLTRAAIKREKMTSRAVGYDVKVVKMLIAVCLVYLCVQIPSITLYIYFKPDFITMLPTTKVAIDIAEILYALNAAANFIVYVSMSEKFANTYKKLLGLKILKTGQRSPRPK